MRQVVPPGIAKGVPAIQVTKAGIRAIPEVTALP